MNLLFIKRMKTGLQLKIKEYFWNSLNKLTNKSTKLIVNNLGNGYIKSFWEISTIDNLRIEASKSCFCAIRLFDISNNRNKNKNNQRSY